MIYIHCECGKRLGFEDSHAGRRGRCPACRQVFTVQTVMAEVGAPPPVPSPRPRQVAAPPPVAEPLDALPVEEDQSIPVAEVEPHREKRKRRRLKKKQTADEGGGFWAPEKAGIRYGVAGGLIMMAIAVVWFVAGLMFDWLFYYPPILFCIGVFALIKGLVTGNIAGEE
jgi:hypothetical protein